MHLHDLPISARPREKWLRSGPDSLKTTELLAILLRTGYRGQSAVQVAERILRRYSLWQLGELPTTQLAKLKGIGVSRAITIKTAFYLAQLLSNPTPKPVIRQPADAVKLTHHLIAKKQEYVVGLYLDSRHQVIHQQTLTVGTVSASLLHPREVFAPALEHRASGVIVVHNHPSGNPEASPEDLDTTDKLVSAGETLDIPLLDHLVVATGGWSSLRQQGHFGSATSAT